LIPSKSDRCIAAKSRANDIPLLVDGWRAVTTDDVYHCCKGSSAFRQPVSCTWLLDLPERGETALGLQPSASQGDVNLREHCRKRPLLLRLVLAGLHPIVFRVDKAIHDVQISCANSADSQSPAEVSAHKLRHSLAAPV
jgi:hypothetical protein